MKRRKFVAAAAASTMVAPYAAANSLNNSDQEGGQEIYELRTYEMAWGGNGAALASYLEDIEGPYLKSMGANHFMRFKETSQAQPSKTWTLASFPDFGSYEKAIAKRTDKNFISKTATYTAAGKTYNRISSSLLQAFHGLKQMKSPIDNASLFELRIYEGLNEDAVRRKIMMFNDEELDLFYKVDLNPIFFGNMLVGPYVPCLVYMLNYRDMEHRDQAWKAFLEHPDWNTMKVKEAYANSVSNITRVFLEPA
jgi:hypothetical protein